MGLGLCRSVQSCHGQGKVRENQNFFKVREKSGEFCKRSRKILEVCQSQ